MGIKGNGWHLISFHQINIELKKIKKIMSQINIELKINKYYMKNYNMEDSKFFFFKREFQPMVSTPNDSLKN